MVSQIFKIIQAILIVQDPTKSKLPPETDNVRGIIGGDDAEVGRYAYTVGLFGDTIGAPENRPYCGGALISPKFVLTAAHCEVGEPNRVVIGRHNFDDETETYEEIKVIQQIINPSYFTTFLIKYDFDFMLLELEEESSYPPIQIDDGSVELQENGDVTAVGWGRVKNGPFSDIFDTTSAVLQTVDMDYVSNFQCQLAYIWPWMQPITSRMMCSQRRGNSVCNGDSGGPLVVKGDQLETDVLIGITSFNIGCSAMFSSVFGRVGSITSWILEHVDDVKIYDPTA